MSDGTTDDSGRAREVGRAAKAEASATTGRAGQAAGEVTATAADQAKEVAGQARQQAGTVLHEMRGRVADEVDGQTRRLAGTVRQWADDLHGLSRDAADSPARGMVTQTADGGHRAADYLDRHGVGDMVRDLEDFARRRPGVFLGGAALAGLVVGRLAKSGGADGSAQPPARKQPSDGTEGTSPEGAERSELPGYPGV
ncbi:hypothetical protein [Streptomyces sp. NPDC018031]|uniref:hypothetical protein n=1 Tax=Streptomyces sp. NPDC018031 TaxID=3365033 RepID=UPI0037B2FEB8